MSQRYELMYILPPTLTENEAPQEAEKISASLKNHGAEVAQEVDLGKKKLAYPINHHHYGYYRLLEINAEPNSLAKLDNVLRLTANLLRYMVIVKPTKSQATIERDQALRARLAAKRQQRAAEAKTISREPALPIKPTLTPEELDKEIEKILEENPDV